MAETGGIGRPEGDRVERDKGQARGAGERDKDWASRHRDGVRDGDEERAGQKETHVQRHRAETETERGCRHRNRESDKWRERVQAAGSVWSVPWVTCGRSVPANRQKGALPCPLLQPVPTRKTDWGGGRTQQCSLELDTLSGGGGY